MRFIGGFFGLELAPESAAGLADFWQMPGDPALCFANARSALAALVASLRPTKVWLPAYLCSSLLAAFDAVGSVEFYPVDESLEPDVELLEAAVRPHALVLAIDYFGQPPHRRFLDFVRSRPDLRFVEDAAQAFDTGIAPWGGWVLRSPRKLVGVADGGFVSPATDIAPDCRACAAPDPHIRQAALARFEDLDGTANDSWHAANQSRESSERVSAMRMSRLSRELLRRAPVAPLAARRRENFDVLATRLAPYRFRPQATLSHVPLGFPIRLRTDERARVRDALHAQGIFPAVHWADLPSPTSFTVAHRLAGELLTLPCDHRYAPSDMERVAQVVGDELKRTP
jgi:dTDP-4-amino-4,6-dideoxygalactose transaminase